MSTVVRSFESINDLSLHIKQMFNDGAKILSLYAFNTTGKTRLADTFESLIEDAENEWVESMNYGVLFEDMFSWDNESYTLYFDVEYSWITRLIRDEGLENRIVDNFRRYTFSYVEPGFNLDEGSVAFRVASGDDESKNNIKISRGEESLLIWSIFRTLLELAVETLDDVVEDRAEHIFNRLKYIVIDDPVSSIDDTKIIDMAIDMVDVIRSLANKGIKVLILTHHALFYNVIANSVPSDRKKYGLYSLSKTDNGIGFRRQDDSPFSYHLFTKLLIQKAIDEGSIERYHFNLFRSLLEKTANFLGYNNWGDCLPNESRERFARLLNVYSHGRLSEIEAKELSGEDKSFFGAMFNQFVQDYKWNS